MSNNTNYKDRLTRFYTAYCPDKLPNVPGILQQYKGKEEGLFQTLVTKYGAEPSSSETNNNIENTTANSSAVVPPPSLQIVTTSSATPNNNNNNNNSNNPPTAPSASESNQNSNVNAASASKTPTKQPNSKTKNNNIDDDDDDALMGDDVDGDDDDMRRAVQKQNNGNDEEEDFDVEEQLRTIVSKSGFVCQEHERKWVQVWLGSLPLSLLTRETTPGKNPVIIQAWGYKNTRKPGLFKSPWKRRFFLVIPPFLYYAENDSPTSKALGCVYLARSKITTEEKDGRQGAVKIETRVNRKPDALDSTGDAAPYFIAFETTRVMETWKVVLEKVSKAPYNQQTGQIESSNNSQKNNSNNNAVNPNNWNSTMSVVGSPRLGGAGVNNMSFADFAVGAVPLAMGLREGSGNTPKSGYLSSNTNNQQQQQQQQFTMMSQQNNNNNNNNSMSQISYNSGGGAGGATPNGSLTPRITSQQQPQQQQNLQEVNFNSNHNNNNNANMNQNFSAGQVNSMGQTAPSLSQQLPASNFSYSATNSNTNNNNYNQGNNYNSSSSQQQQQVSQPSNFPIDMKDLLTRVKRVSRDKDPQSVIDLLFQHVESHPGDIGVIWKLMLAMDDAPLKPQPQVLQQPAPQVQLLPLPNNQQQQQQQQPMKTITYSQLQQQFQNSNNNNSVPAAAAAVVVPLMGERSLSPPPPQNRQNNNIQQQQQLQNQSSSTASPTPSNQSQQMASGYPTSTQNITNQEQQQPNVLATVRSGGGGGGSRSNSFDLLPLNLQHQQQQQQQQSGEAAGTMNNAIQSALSRSSNRRQMIDQMLSGLPK